MRRWTWIDEDVEDVSEDELEERVPILDAWAEQWSALREQMEHGQFRHEFERDEPGYDPGPPEAEAGREVTRRLQRAQLEIIEGELERLGARMMRPYEHWGEDEAYMAWSERDRD